MNTLKSLVDSVISDLTENKSIESILLKTQTISHYLKDEEFSTWIKHELNGYGDDEYPLPDYRKINCIVKVDISQPFGRMAKNYPFPCEYIKDDKIRERMTHMAVFESLSEIELMMKDDKHGNDLTIAVPQYIVQNYMEKYVEGYILVANQHINMNNIQAVISKFKSLLLTFFLELNDKMNWELNFDVMATKQIIKQIMVTNNINAAVVATEGSTISTGAVSVENSHIGNVAYSNEQKEFLSVLKDIEKIKQIFLFAMQTEKKKDPIMNFEMEYTGERENVPRITFDSEFLDNLYKPSDAPLMKELEMKEDLNDGNAKH